MDRTARLEGDILRTLSQGRHAIQDSETHGSFGAFLCDAGFSVQQTRKEMVEDSRGTIQQNEHFVERQIDWIDEMNESQSEMWKKRRKRVERLSDHLCSSELAHMTDEEVAKASRRIASEEPFDEETEDGS